MFSFIVWKYGGIEIGRPKYDMELHVRSGPFQGNGFSANIYAFKCYNKYGFYVKNPPEWKVSYDGVNHVMHRLLKGNTSSNSLFIDLHENPIPPPSSNIPADVKWKQIITA
jgi:hypothetical protein